MQVTQIISGQSARLIKLNPPKGGIFIPDLQKAIIEKYSFLISPSSLDDWNAEKGITFAHGKFNFPDSNISPKKEHIVIDKLQIFRNGVSVDTSSSTEDADLIIEDMLNFAVKTMGYSISSTIEPINLPASQLEVQMESPFIKIFSQSMQGISKKLSAYFVRNSGFEAKFEPFGFNLRVNQTDKLLPIIPVSFKIERREGIAYEKNIYFSVAPLPTKDHINLLKLIEAS